MDGTFIYYEEYPQNFETRVDELQTMFRALNSIPNRFIIHNHYENLIHFFIILHIHKFLFLLPTGFYMDYKLNTTDRHTTNGRTNGETNRKTESTSTTQLNSTFYQIIQRFYSLYENQDTIAQKRL